ncbi:MAG TPA: hypothetical protein VF103_12535 [Polyangiaceae bacterium]
MLSKAQPERPLDVAPADTPLTPREVARMKEHFRFLREHRHELKLRVNAAEDLLLNGSREPTHRGVCQHLLAKVERARVLAVSERLPAAEAVRFLGGILRFAPEIPYVLKFLSCVRASASGEQAAAALSYALLHIEFAETSSAQIRQILTLIVEVFPPREMPLLLLSLLASAPFRDALDRSADELPPSLADMVLPLRAARAALFREGQPRAERGAGGSRDRAPDLERGVLLLLRGATSGLLELEVPQRRRLFELGGAALEHADASADQVLERLAALLGSLPWPNDGERAGALRRLIGAALAANLTQRARSLLDEELRQRPNTAPFAQWRKMLDAPRLGAIAIEPPEGRNEHGQREPRGALPPPGRWYRGWHVPTQTFVRIRLGDATENERIAELVRSWRRALVPGVARIVEHGGGERPYFALSVSGRNFARVLEDPRALDVETCREWCVEICQLLAALGRFGVELPDAAPHRFSVDQAGRLWLVDPWDAESRAPEVAEPAHVRHARELVWTILDAARTPLLSGAVVEALSSAETFERIVELLEGG